MPVPHLVHNELKPTMFVSYANAHHFSLALSDTWWTER
jgi:hypothetical protein